MKDLDCPYCDESMEPPDECWTEGETYDTECDHCEKKFTFTISYNIDYSSEQADCLNGDAEHDWQRRNGSPECAFAGKRQCSICGEKRQEKPEPDEWAAVEDEAAKYEYARAPLARLREKYPD